MSMLVHAEKVVSLGREVAAIIARAVDEPGLRDALIASAVAGSTTDALAAQLNAGDREMLDGFFARIAERADLPDTIEALLSPVSAISETDPIAWSFDKSTDALPTPGSLTLSLGGSAALSAGILAGPTYRLHGSLGLAGSLQVPFSFGAFGAEASASTQATIEARFTPPNPHALVVTALIEDLPKLVALTNLDVVLESNVENITVNVEGDVNFAASLSAGKVFSVDRDFDGAVVKAEARVAAGYQVAWAKRGEFGLVVSKPEGESGVLVSVEQKHRHSSARTLSLGAEVKISGLREALAPAMHRISQAPAPIEEFLQTYSNPSVLLRGKLEELLTSDNATLQSLADAITGADTADSFAAELIEIVAAEFDARAGSLGADLLAEASEVAAEAVNRISFPDPTLKNRLLLELQSKLEESVNGVLADQREKLIELLQSHGEEVTKVIERLGGGLNEVLADVDETARRLLQPLQLAVAKYREIEQSIAAAIERVEQEKLAIAYSRSIERSSARERLLSVLIKNVNDTTSAIYASMLAGDLSGAFELGLLDDNDDIELRESVFTEMFARRKTSGLTIDLFGFEISSSRTVVDEVTVTVEGGKVAVAQAGGKITHKKTWFGEKLSLTTSSFGNYLEVAGTEDPGTALTMAATYEDPDLAPRELERHLRPFERMQLIAAGATDRALRALGEAPRNMPITLSTVLGFESRELDAIAATSREHVVETAMENLVLALQLDRTASGVMQKIEDRRRTSAIRAIRELRGLHDQALNAELGGSARPRDLLKMKLIVRRVNRNSEDLADYLEGWTQLREMGAVPVVNGAADAGFVAMLDETNEQMVDDLEPWTQVSGLIRDPKREDLSPWALAFLKCMSDLSGQTTPLVPIISWQEGEQVRRIAVV